MEGEGESRRLYPLLHQQAPSFVLPDADDTLFDLTDAIGKKGILLIFIDSDCPYCIPSLERWIQANMEQGSDLHAAVLLKEGGIGGYQELYSHSKGIRFLQAGYKIFESYRITEYPYFVYVNSKQEIEYASPDPEGGRGRQELLLHSCAE
ncbi:redoxin domain-containing protein [Paenibacillus melissococcoides]|nr:MULTISPECIES: redoxin domain-containing protein [Paenibacillus]MEB9893919.1 redoxin domain-containing protein [Bacillus cereus]CAH8718993.1 redoxin domain-containing protein [Paenibacillus melissococcoides]CAH8720000.1 redoxin domain-containing protein [Paenibacillus melissococcoides]